MNLYIKQEIFTFKDRFYVKDENGKDIYSVEGEIFSWGKRLHIYNAKNEEVALLKQKLWSFKPTFEVYIENEKEAVVVKEISLTPKYSIQGPDWEVKGDFWAHNYEILDGEEFVVKISKKWFSWGDTYELDIKDSSNEILALAVVLSIDAVLSYQSSSSD
jgi:uncharacterized protein YxjI